MVFSARVPALLKLLQNQELHLVSLQKEVLPSQPQPHTCIHTNYSVLRDVSAQITEGFF